MRVEGSGAACVFAFMRRLGPDAALTVLPVRAAPLFGSDYPLGQRWGDTRLVLPEESPDTPYPRLVDTFTGKRLPRDEAILLRDALSSFPVALFAGRSEQTAP